MTPPGTRPSTRHGALRWSVEGLAWPHRGASHFVKTPGLVWHVQQMGSGPALLLLHGTGASCHSWRGLMPLLARDFTLIVPDLPGHGFTTGRPAGGLALDAIAAATADLLEAIALEPALLVGHSAGAAIALALAQRRGGAPVVGFNPALLPFPGPGAWLFPSLARLLFVNPLVPRLFAGMARLPGETGRFLRRATGSTIDAAGLACYAALLGNHRHCEGVLEMMANWDLDAFARALPDMPAPALLVHSADDPTVPLDAVRRAARLLPDARLALIDSPGHLSHEVHPDRATDLILRFARDLSLMPGDVAVDHPA